MRILLAAIIALTVATTSARANTLTASEALSLDSLWTKLYSANVDITQTMRSNPPSIFCLSQVHDHGDTVLGTATAIRSLVTLAAVMKDTMDESLVLDELQLFIKAMVYQLPRRREQLNKLISISPCAGVAIAAAKGQTILDIFSELDEQVTYLQNKLVPAL